VPPGGERREIELRIDSRLDQVALVGLCVERIAREAGLGEGDAYSVELCVVEAVSNAIRHAYRGEKGHHVWTRVRLGGSRLEIRIEHEGIPLPEEKRHPPSLADFDPEDPATIPAGGRGLFLIHSLMDEVRHEASGRRAVLVMTKALPARGAAPRRAGE
jgi:serine/threonine-protein kinase RsbW